jgi:hypothetical protein
VHSQRWCSFICIMNEKWGHWWCSRSRNRSKGLHRDRAPLCLTRWIYGQTQATHNTDALINRRLAQRCWRNTSCYDFMTTQQCLPKYARKL